MQHLAAHTFPFSQVAAPKEIVPIVRLCTQQPMHTPVFLRNLQIHTSPVFCETFKFLHPLPGHNCHGDLCLLGHSITDRIRCQAVLLVLVHASATMAAHLSLVA